MANLPQNTSYNDEKRTPSTGVLPNTSNQAVQQTQPVQQSTNPYQGIVSDAAHNLISGLERTARTNYLASTPNAFNPIKYANDLFKQYSTVRTPTSNSTNIANLVASALGSKPSGQLINPERGPQGEVIYPTEEKTISYKEYNPNYDTLS